MRASSLLASALVVALSSTALGGCIFSRAAGRSLGPLVSSPRKVAALDDPVAHGARLAVLWVGHATALVQIDDKFVLTDPVFTSSVGQLSKRLVEPGLDPRHLPPVDAVLVSHMHFDHLSYGSLDAIERKVRMLLMPRGGVAYLPDYSFPVVELGRWQAWEQGGLRVTAVPVEHMGFRYGIDAAWATESFTGYVIEYHGIKVYFGGDTAYDQKNFVETAERFPGIDLALLPIAPIEPRDFMRRYHLDPREALQASVDLGAARMVPIHYDTFVNATDRPGDALRALRAAIAERPREGRNIVPLAIGERRVLLDKGQPSASGPRPKESTGAASPVPQPPPSGSSPAPKLRQQAPSKDETSDDDKLD